MNQTPDRLFPTDEDDKPDTRNQARTVGGAIGGEDNNFSVHVHEDGDSGNDERNRRKDIDWLIIEQDFRAGIRSASSIAEEHGIAVSTVTRKAKKEGWTRNLAQKVRELANEHLSISSYDGGDAQSSVAGMQATHAGDEGEQIKRAAQTQVSIVREHRRDIARLRTVHRLVLDKAETMARRKGAFKTPQELRDAAQTVDALTRIVSKTIPLERQAFNIDGVGPDASSNALEERIRRHQETKVATRKAKTTTASATETPMGDNVTSLEGRIAKNRESA